MLYNYPICESCCNSYGYSQGTRTLMRNVWGDVSFDGGVHLSYDKAKQSILERLSENVDYSEASPPEDPSAISRRTF